MDPERERARCVGSRWVLALQGRVSETHLAAPDNRVPQARPLPAPSLFHLGVLGVVGADFVRPEAAAGGARGSR